MRIILLLCAALALTIAAVPEEEEPAVQEIHQDGELPVEAEVEEVKIPVEEKLSDCPTRFQKYGSRCFIFINKEMTWVEAERYCLRYSTNLASIRNLGEYEFIQGLVSQQKPGVYPQAWLGGNDAVENNVWLWSDGSSFHFQDWSYGEPSNSAYREHCLVMNYKSSSFLWGDVNCGEYRPFVCGTRPH